MVGWGDDGHNFGDGGGCYGRGRGGGGDGDGIYRCRDDSGGNSDGRSNRDEVVVVKKVVMAMVKMVVVEVR